MAYWLGPDPLCLFLPPSKYSFNVELTDDTRLAQCPATDGSEVMLYCFTALLLYCFTALLLYCFTALLLYCLIAIGMCQVTVAQMSNTSFTRTHNMVVRNRFFGIQVPIAEGTLY